MSGIDRDFARLEAGEDAAQPTQQPTLRTAAKARALALTRKPLLTLETVAPLRPTIRIDTFDYRLPLYDDFSFWQHERMAKLGERAQEIRDLALADDALEVTVQQWAELDHLSLDIYGEMVEVILPDLPAPTRRALTLAHREAIVRAFFAANQSKSAGQEETASAAPPTGGRSSVPSSRATGTGAGGRAKPRSGNSAPPTGV
jgi:hypothetical protein